jgi:hypothetical protein
MTISVSRLSTGFRYGLLLIVYRVKFNFTLPNIVTYLLFEKMLNIFACYKAPTKEDLLHIGKLIAVFENEFEKTFTSPIA